VSRLRVALRDVASIDSSPSGYRLAARMRTAVVLPNLGL